MGSTTCSFYLNKVWYWGQTRPFSLCPSFRTRSFLFLDPEALGRVISPFSLIRLFFHILLQQRNDSSSSLLLPFSFFFLYLWLSKRENDPELVPILYPVVCLDERKRWTMMAAGPSVAGRPAEVPGENYWDPVRCYRRRPVKVVHL